MVDVEVIKRLVEIMIENDLAEVSLRDGEEEISLKKAPAHQTPAVFHVPFAGTASAAPAAASPDNSAAVPRAKAEEDADAGLLTVRSPMVGTLYAAPDPDSPSYVKVGDVVTPETVVCIIEAMKVFNEIKAGLSGRIERILVANALAVEFDQPLFLVRPT